MVNYNKTKMKECSNPECKNLTKSKYCSKQCQYKKGYIDNKEKRIKKVRLWQLKNKDRVKEINKKSFNKFYNEKKSEFNKLMRNNYQRNKSKYQSRKSTSDVIRKESGILTKECKGCGSIERLEIHHEIYPTKVKEVKQAILSKKIYYLCKDCHRKETNKLNLNIGDY